MPVRYLINALLFVAFLIVGLSLIQSGVITKYYTKVLMLIGISIILTVSTLQPAIWGSFRWATRDSWRSAPTRRRFL